MAVRTTRQFYVALLLVTPGPVLACQECGFYAPRSPKYCVLASCSKNTLARIKTHTKHSK